MQLVTNTSLKLFRHPDRVAAWQRGEFVAPIGMEADLSNRCNLGCTFCHFGYTHTRGPLASRAMRAAQSRLGDLMDFDLWCGRIIPQLKQVGVRSLTLSGGGEPTLHPQFRELASAALAAGLPLGLYTNATLLSAELAAFIKANFRWVVVSLDEPCAEEYREAKQSDQFEAALTGIRRLVSAAGAARITISFLLRPTNLNRIEEMLRVYRSLGADRVEFRPIVLTHYEDPTRLLEPPFWVDEAVTALGRLGLLSAPDVEVPLDKFQHLRRWERAYPVCHAVRFTGVITPNGKVWVCVNRRGLPDSEVGDLTTETFRDVWARQTARTDFQHCRVLCRGDQLNRTLDTLDHRLPDEEFV